MNKRSKILTTVVITILSIFIMSILNIKYENGSQLRTLFGCFLLYVVIRSIWKTPYKNHKSRNLPLDKSN